MLTAFFTLEPLYHPRTLLLIPFLYKIRGFLKNRILVQGQGKLEFQSAGILKYFEELKLEFNAEIGPKDIFKFASNTSCLQAAPSP
jgi:hypothetical protein